MFAKIVKFLLILLVTVTLSILVSNVPFLTVGVKLIAITIWFRILGSNIEYYTKIIWLMIIFLNPFFGLLCYITFGRTSREKQIYKKKTKTDLLFKKYEKDYSTLETTDEYLRILKNLGKNNIYRDTSFLVLQNGREKFPKLIEKILNAKDHIHLEYYIIRDGEITSQIIDALIKKANEGVIVRVLYDAVGSSEFSNVNIHRLKNNNVKVAAFGEVFIPIFSSTFNFRNHRKIVVIDNEFGFIGGHNIADEYVGYSKKYGNWRDTHLMLEGKAVRELQLSFAKDWYYATGENFIERNKDRYLKKYIVENCEEHVQILNNGPDNKFISTKDVYFKLITTAKKQITILTPYFVPDYDIIKALVTASENEVDVRILLPGNPDNIAVHGVTRTYYETLLTAGIKVYEVQDTFLHSKVLIIDDNLSTIGTTNIDFRSFNLNFEITAFIQSKKVRDKLIADTEKDISNSKQIILEEWLKRPQVNKYGANLVQIFSPML